MPRHVALDCAVPYYLTARTNTVSPLTKDLDFRGLDSGRFISFRGGNPKFMGNFPELQNQRFLVCEFLVCGLTVFTSAGISALSATQPRNSQPRLTKRRSGALRACRSCGRCLFTAQKLTLTPRVPERINFQKVNVWGPRDFGSQFQ